MFGSCTRPEDRVEVRVHLGVVAHEEEGRVDPVESLEGAEEYYVGSGEARGVWLGAGSAQLGLAVDVDGADLRAVLADLDPRDGSVPRSGRGGVRAI